MDTIYRFILENIANKNIEKDTAKNLISLLKNKGNISKNNDIAIIGMAGYFPMANSVNQFWKNLKNEVDSISEYPEKRKKSLEFYFSEQNQKIDLAKGGYLEQIDQFDPAFFKISPIESDLMDPHQRLFLQTAYKAIEDAGYGGGRIEGSRTGVFLGFGSVCSNDYKNLFVSVDESARAIGMTGNIPAIIAGRISYLLNLKGPALITDTACSSALVATHLATQAILNGDCEMALAGGIKLSIIPFVNSEEAGIGIESSDFKAYSFDDSSDGTAWGEAVGAVLLKPLKKAIEDKDNIYAVIKGSGINSDGASNGITAPNPVTQTDVIIKAWKKAGIDPNTISYIETHGTGTNLGDPIEIDGISEAFKKYTNKKQFCAIGSNKPNVGHCDSISGMVSLIKSALMLKNKCLLPSIHFKQPNRNIDFEDSPIYINDKLRKWESDIGPLKSAISAFGLSGTNCHLVLEEAPQIDSGFYDGYYMLPVSAKSAELLHNYVKDYLQFIEENPTVNLADLCYTAAIGREHFKSRLIIVFKSYNDLVEKLNDINKNGLSAADESNIFFGHYKIVSAKKIEKDKTDKTEKEITSLSKASAWLLEKEFKLSDLKNVQKLADLYVQGAKTDFESLYKEQKRKIISAPTYPFEKRSCWVDNFREQRIGAELEDSFIFDWKEQTIELQKEDLTQELIVILKNENSSENLLNNFIKKLESLNKNVFTIQLGEKYLVNKKTFTITNSQEDFTKFIQEINQEGSISKIISFRNFSDLNDKKDFKSFSNNVEEIIKSNIYLIKALHANKLRGKIHLAYVSKPSYYITNKEKNIYPENAIFQSLLDVIENENMGYLQLLCKNIDADDSIEVQDLINELYGDFKENVFYRDRVRYIREMKNFDLKESNTQKIEFKDDGVYIVSGGAGDLGYEVAKYIAEKNPSSKIILLGRTKLPKRKDWESILNEEKSTYYSKILKIRELEKKVSFVDYYSVDVSNYEDMKTVVDDLIQKHGRINGVFHLAGLNESQFISNVDESDFINLIKPKVYGAWILNSLINDADFFVFFSSIASFLATPTTAAYAASNVYLDALASYNALNNVKTFSINWAAWLEQGLAKQKEGVDNVFNAISVAKGIKFLDKILDTDISNIICGSLNYESKHVDFINRGKFVLGKNIVSRIINKKEPKKPLNQLKFVKTEGKNDGNYSENELKMANIWGKLLGYDKINIDDNFFEIGGDSILAAKMLPLLEKENLELDLTLLFQNQTIRELAPYLSKVNTGNLEEENLEDKNENDDTELVDEGITAYKKGFITANDNSKIYYEYYGNKLKPCIIGFSGIVMQVSSWYQLVPKILENYDILLWDYRGSGNSTAGSYFKFEDLVDDLEQIVNELNLTQEIHLLGISTGAIIAAEYLRRNHQKVGKVVFTGICLNNDLSRDVRFGSSTDILKKDITLWTKLLFCIILSENYLRTLKRTLLETSIKLVVERYSEKVEVLSNLHSAEHTYLKKIKESYPEFSKIENEILVLYGENDCWTPPSVQKDLKNLFPHVQYKEYPEVGHLPFIEIPDDFLEDIHQFLELNSVQKSKKTPCILPEEKKFSIALNHKIDMPFYFSPLKIYETILDDIVVEEGIKEIKKNQYHYEIFGDRQKPLLIIFNSIGLTSENFRFFMPYLLNDLTVLLCDLPGQGKSKLNKEEISVEEFSEDLMQILSELELDKKKVHLLGISTGAVFASDFLRKFPKIVGKVILSSTILSLEDFFIYRMETTAKINELDNSLIADYYFTNLFSNKYLSQLEKNTLNDFKATFQKYNSKESIKQFLEIEKKYLEEIDWFYFDFNEIENPILLMIGKDNAIYPKYLNEKILTMFKNIQYDEFEDAGHFLFLEQSSKFFTNVVNFILDKNK